MAEKIRILVADSQPLVADCLAIALSCYPDIDVLPVRPNSGADVVESAWQNKPDIAVLEYRMDLLGPAATQLIHRKAPLCRVVLTSWLFGPPEKAACFHAGASALLPRTTTVAELAEAIRAVHSGQMVPEAEAAAPDPRTQQMLDRSFREWDRLSKLTPVEIRVLNLLALGNKTDAICESLSISKATARTHVQNILRKLKAHSALEAVAIARQFGFVSN